MAAFADLQSAVYAALMGEPAVTAIVSTRIFDDIPHEQESTSTAFPRITIGEQDGEEAGADDMDISQVSITVHAWSRSAGRKECLNLLSAIVKSIHRKEHFVANGVLVFLIYGSHETTKEPDGETYHGAVTFNGLLQFG